MSGWLVAKEPRQTNKYIAPSVCHLFANVSVSVHYLSVMFQKVACKAESDGILIEPKLNGSL